MESRKKNIGKKLGKKLGKKPVSISAQPINTNINSANGIDLNKSEEHKPVEKKKLSFAITAPDIEVNIPAPKIFMLNPTSEHEDLPQGSLSPCFPGYNGRFSSSSNSSQGPYDINRSNSPVSVHNIPNSVGIFHEFPQMTFVSESNITKNDMVNCEVCQREVKSKSLKVHLRTRIHKNNLKSNK